MLWFFWCLTFVCLYRINMEGVDTSRTCSLTRTMTRTMSGWYGFFSFVCLVGGGYCHFLVCVKWRLMEVSRGTLIFFHLKMKTRLFMCVCTFIYVYVCTYVCTYNIIKVIYVCIVGDSGGRSEIVFRQNFGPIILVQKNMLQNVENNLPPKIFQDFP